ncbi:MAG: IS91 family transposase [Myxococcota bacterium]
MVAGCPAAPGGSATSTGLAELFRRFGPTYLRTHVLSPEQARALRHIIDCRTPAMGGHEHSCDRCGHSWCAYNSCRDRHCPICQGLQQRRWIERRMERLLPTHHFHVVFTEPEALRPLNLANRKVLYNLLFASATDTLMQLADERWDALPGITSVLHTWTRRMQYHPHLHCIVTGGGLAEDGGWFSCGPRFLFPVKVLGALFRGKFLAGLRALFDAGELRFVGTSAHLQHPVAFEGLLDELYRQSWVVYAKRPFGGPTQLVRYLGLYTHRVGISNSRLLSFTDDEVVFETRKGTSPSRVHPDEFLRRLLLHTLPKGFRKIRHRGLYAPSNVRTKLRYARYILEGLNRQQRRHAAPALPPSPPPVLRNDYCPACGYWPLRHTRLPPVRGPPCSAPPGP